MKNCVLIRKKYLAFRREDIGAIRQTIQRKFERKIPKVIFLDFTPLEFISRSAADELLNLFADFKKRRIIIKNKNLKPSLAAFLRQVKETKEKANI